MHRPDESLEQSVLRHGAYRLHLSTSPPLNPARKPLSRLARNLEAERFRQASRQRVWCLSSDLR